MKERKKNIVVNFIHSDTGVYVVRRHPMVQAPGPGARLARVQRTKQMFIELLAPT